MGRRTQRSVLCLQAVALPVLLLLLLPQDVQAQQQPAKDTSWMPKVTTKNLAGSGLAAGQQAGVGDTEADAPAVPIRRPGMTAGPQASKQPAATTAGSPSQNPDAADPVSPEAIPASSPSKAGAADGGAAAATRVQRAGVPTKLSVKGSSKTPAGQGLTGPKAKAAAANPPGSLHNVLAKNTPLFRSLLTVLGIGPEDVSLSTVGTFFAPTDDAISEFLSSMGLSASQLAARPELVDLIVSYHFAPGYQVRGAEDVVGSSRVLLTGDEQYTMKIWAAAGSGNLTLSDVQKISANVVDGPITPEGNSIAVFVIDKVLRSGNYFLNLESALGHSPYWISAKSLAIKAGVLQQLEGRPVTLLVPDNTAFKPLETNLSRASTGRMADILKYHVLPKVRRLPKGFETGTTETLLKGHSLDINMTSEMQKDPFSGSKDKTILVPILRITPEVGRTAQVNYYNIFAGPAILHGIDQLLMPDLPQDPNELPLPPEDSPDGEGKDGDNEGQEPPAGDEQPADGGAGAGELPGPDDVGEGDAPEDPPTNNSSAAGRVRTGGPAAAAAVQRSMTPETAAAGAGGGGGGIVPPSGSAAGRLRPATTPPVSVEAGVRGEASDTTGSAAAAANGVRGSLPLLGAVSARLTGQPAAASGVGTGMAAPGSGLRGTAPGAGTGAVAGPGLGSGGAGRKPPNAAALDADAADGSGRRLLQAAVRLWTPRRMLVSGLWTARKLLQMTPATRPRSATAAATSAPTAMPSAKAAGTGAGAAAGKPRAKTVPAFGALSSAVPVGSVGQLQTFANGISSNKTLVALTRASVPKVPKEYVNRYGALKGPTVKGGCLNCKAWGDQPQ